MSAWRRLAVRAAVAGAHARHHRHGRLHAGAARLQYGAGPDAQLNDPAATPGAVLTALRQPVGSEIREMLVMALGESSWP
ncbi:hypothetical protein [Cellulomonas sp. NTE-D12]|uniref:hypothetical protein n=1 Tax=Cellulomonas sp. NTE-D12 TaxID=2962632 RepID=UPI0030817942